MYLAVNSNWKKHLCFVQITFWGCAFLVLCATGLHCPRAKSYWAMQCQCAEVLEFELHASCQCRDGLDNEGRSIYPHQSRRIATQIYTRVESAIWSVFPVVRKINSATFTPCGIVLGRVTRSMLTNSDSLAFSQLRPDSRTQLGKPVAH